MKPKQKTKVVKAWAIICSRSGFAHAVTTKEKAEISARELDDKYHGACGHSVVKAIITLHTEVKKKKK